MKCANNSNAMVVSSMVYCGLVSGYQGENNTATPQNAAEAVYAAGCPKGGEPVGAYIASGTPEEILDEAEKLRRDLKQTTLSVGLPEVGVATIGFVATAHLPLLVVGDLWQKSAARLFAETGTYVSCGMAEVNGVIHISAEANPAFVQDLVTWKSIVETICREVGADAPSFTEVGFNYLKDEA